MSKIWNFLTNEKNNRGINLIVIILGFVFGIFQIRSIGIDLKDIKSNSVETEKISAPLNKNLILGQTKDGDPDMIITPNGPPILKLGSSADVNINPCFEMKLSNSRDFVHFFAKPAGNSITWENGSCPY